MTRFEPRTFVLEMTSLPTTALSERILQIFVLFCKFCHRTVEDSIHSQMQATNFKSLG